MAKTAATRQRDARVQATTGTAHSKPCACTGMRWCAACRDPALRAQWGMREPVGEPAFLTARDVLVGPAPGGSTVYLFDTARQAAPGCPAFAGLVVWPDFVSEDEAERLLAEIESRPFTPAQSGKGKQHFGPRMNFRKQRMNPRGFEGLPRWGRALEARVRDRAASESSVPGLVAALDAYVTTDAFVLRYDVGQASNLDLHVDDTFAYGELILDLSLESDGWLTFLDADPQRGVDRPFACVRARVPARSMALLFGPARYDWFHGIRALDVEGRRTSLTLRTLGSSLRSTDEGRHVVARAARVLDGPGDAPL